MATRWAWRLVPRLAEFEGLWQLERQIVPAQGSAAHLTGQAWFERSEQGLTYAEAGDLRMVGQPVMRAERRYLWQAVAGGAIAVRFDDGRAFHQIDPTNTQARHWCDPDTYDVHYDFTKFPQWQSVWTVHGPRKDYRMTSWYQRIP